MAFADTPGITPLKPSLHADMLLLYRSQGALLHPQAGTEGFASELFASVISIS